MWWPETDKSMEETCCQGLGYPPVLPGRLLGTLWMAWTLTNPSTAFLLGAISPGRMALPKDSQGWLGASMTGDVSGESTRDVCNKKSPRAAEKLHDPSFPQMTDPSEEPQVDQAASAGRGRDTLSPGLRVLLSGEESKQHKLLKAHIHVAKISPHPQTGSMSSSMLPAGHNP